MYFWHPCVLHGTQPTVNNKFRVSIRILIEKNQIHNVGEIDVINKTIMGQLSVKLNRKDINKDGAYIKKGNFINQHKI